MNRRLQPLLLGNSLLGPDPDAALSGPVSTLLSMKATWDPEKKQHVLHKHDSLVSLSRRFKYWVFDQHTRN